MEHAYGNMFKAEIPNLGPGVPPRSRENTALSGKRQENWPRGAQSFIPLLI